MIRKIIGPPGTGKTTELLRRLESSGAPWDRVAFLSLTKDAIAVARSRAFEKGATEKQLRYFRTQHSINRRLLNISPKQLVVNHYMDFIKQYRYRFSESLFDIKKPRKRESAETSDDFMMELYNKARSLRVDWQTLAEKTPSCRAFIFSIGQMVERYNTWKESQDIVDFFDLIEIGIDKELVPDVDVMFIDEAQDCSPLMFEQIKFWSEQIPTFYIAGDYNQAIYGFMGADAKLFKNFPADETIFLDKSFRLKKNIYDFAMKVIRRNEGEEGLAFTPMSDGGFIRQVPTIWSVAEGIKKIGKDKTFMLLARDQWGLGSAIKKLRQSGVPCGGSQANAAAVSLIRRRPEVITKFDLTVLLDSKLFPSKRSAADLSGYWEYGAKTKIKEKIEEGFSPIKTADISTIGGTPALKNALQSGDISIINLSAEELRYYDMVERDWAGRFDVVQSYSHHGSKGREADVIIVLEDVTKKVRELERWKETREEENRLWYVALTRAKDGLILVPASSAYSTTII